MRSPKARVALYVFRLVRFLSHIKRFTRYKNDRVRTRGFTWVDSVTRLILRRLKLPSRVSSSPKPLRGSEDSAGIGVGSRLI